MDLLKDTTQKYYCDERGRLVGVPAHDALLRDISYSAVNRTLLFEGGSDSCCFSIQACGVINLCISELWEGLIFNDIYIWLAETADEDHAWCSLLRGRVEDAWQQEAKRLRNANPDALLLKFESSYGGEGTVICRDISINGQSVRLL